jgi:hypothetical protein
LTGSKIPEGFGIYRQVQLVYSCIELDSQTKVALSCVFGLPINSQEEPFVSLEIDHQSMPGSTDMRGVGGDFAVAKIRHCVAVDLGRDVGPGEDPLV